MRKSTFGLLLLFILAIPEGGQTLTPSATNQAPTPEFVFPRDGATHVPRPVRFRWKYKDGEEGTFFQVFYRPSGTQLWQPSIWPIFGKTITIDDLEPNTTYQAFVIAWKEVEPDTRTEVIEFTTGTHPAAVGRWREY